VGDRDQVGAREHGLVLSTVIDGAAVAAIAFHITVE
jgi:hypothetical protein